MYIVYQEYFPYSDFEWFTFTLETEDFIDGIGNKFILELKLCLNDEAYITYKFGKYIIFTVDMEYFRLFLKIFKQYYPKKFYKQKIRILYVPRQHD